jgi:hydrogenase maturation factor
MCLGEVGQVLETGPGPRAVVRTASRTSSVSLLTLDSPLAPGDWVVCHSGFALSRVTDAEAAEANAIRATTTDPTLTAAHTEDER